MHMHNSNMWFALFAGVKTDKGSMIYSQLTHERLLVHFLEHFARFYLFVFAWTWIQEMNSLFREAFAATLESLTLWSNSSD